MTTLFGIRVIENSLCVKTSVTYELQRSQIKKRRRNWRVVKVEKQVPVAYMLPNNAIAIHPHLVAKLRNQIGVFTL